MLVGMATIFSPLFQTKYMADPPRLVSLFADQPEYHVYNRI